MERRRRMEKPKDIPLVIRDTSIFRNCARNKTMDKITEIGAHFLILLWGFVVHIDYQ